MTNEEAKNILLKRGKVIYNGHPYKMLNIVYGLDNHDRFKVSAVLQDLNGCDSVSQVLIKDIEKEYTDDNS